MNDQAKSPTIVLWNFYIAKMGRNKSFLIIFCHNRKKNERKGLLYFFLFLDLSVCKINKEQTKTIFCFEVLLFLLNGFFCFNFFVLIYYFEFLFLGKSWTRKFEPSIIFFLFLKFLYMTRFPCEPFKSSTFGFLWNKELCCFHSDQMRADIPKEMEDSVNFGFNFWGFFCQKELLGSP